MSMLVVTILFLFCFSNDAEGQYISLSLVHVAILNFEYLFQLHVLYYSVQHVCIIFFDIQMLLLLNASSHPEEEL